MKKWGVDEQARYWDLVSEIAAKVVYQECAGLGRSIARISEEIVNESVPICDRNYQDPFAFLKEKEPVE
jgi:hypothetical protein